MSLRSPRALRPAALALAAAGALVVSLIVAPAAQAGGGHHPSPPSSEPDLGPNVTVFDPSMPTADIAAKAAEIYDQQVADEFGDGRYALLFKPGTYGTPDAPLRIKVGYYTEVAGLGLSPDDVVINGAVEVYNRCLDGAGGNCVALTNFWRSLSNLSIVYSAVGADDGCHATANFWAVSQAAPMRRVHITGGTFSLMDYCSGPSYASGGYIADSDLPTTVNGSQQQFYVRDSSVASWSNAVWNQVFSGVVGAPADNFLAGQNSDKYTTLASTPVSREKPFLYVDARGKWNVFVPAIRTASSDVSWRSGTTKGRSIPLSSFYVAKPGDSARTINAQLDRGRQLLLTPGIYSTTSSIDVKRANTIVLGLGLASIVPTRGNIAMTTSDEAGIDVAGIMFDAGAKTSPALLVVGSGHHGRFSAQHGGGWPRPWNRDPIVLQDVFFRIGGAHAGSATQSLVVNADRTVIDHTWAWRADHGEGVGWTVNKAETGVLVNGDDVLATGLFSEHFQKYNVVWNGERGRTIFFQNELPYDAPNQAAWKHGSTLGWAAYKVSDKVRTHEAWGLGAYIYTNVDPTLHLTQAFEVPKRSGVKLHHMVAVSLNDAGTIDSIVNGVGGPVVPAPGGSTWDAVVEYPAP
ncbi:adenylyl cyclase [Cellulomonas composti]|uniref:Coagulation factor 5/8 type n=1 Tax=Cellulomonas composti TaxID=266130 RepID=A0A511J9I5_9CELL|nr:adenylyl cyclase [Cellulomonas composti]GEL94661.1 hypothetical protein CCO02nite_13190 [Cellulomonas composti]